MNILITGSNGQLGTEMRNLSTEHPNHRYFFTDVAELDITDKEAVQHFVQTNAIDLIVNCAAYTNVDKAEEDEPTAHLINARAVENLALASLSTKIIHISTDYVFSGDETAPCRENDPVAPRTAYGRTKLEGEQLLLKHCPDAVIIRTAWLYSPYGNNFVKTMLRLSGERDELRVVNDQIGTTDEGVCSWYDFTVEIMRQAGRQTKVLPIKSSEYAYKTPRPHYSVLDKTKIKNTFGIVIPQWQESLAKCLARL